MPLWRLEPSAVKVARWVLREAALGNKCRPPDRWHFLRKVPRVKLQAYEASGQKQVNVNALQPRFQITCRISKRQRPPLSVVVDLQVLDNNERCATNTQGRSIGYQG